MQCSVISNNADGFVTIDGGYKCFATDGPKPEVATESLPGASYDRFGDEHGKIVLSENCQKPVIGTPVTLITPHCDPTVNLHNFIHCVRGDKLVDIWPVNARGVL
jgi:D-serine deaminase-like pyridoxal phosphate-dependent protein